MLVTLNVNVKIVGIFNSNKNIRDFNLFINVHNVQVLKINVLHVTETEMETQIKSNRKFWKPPSFEDFNVLLPNKKLKLDTVDVSEENHQGIPNEPNEPKTVKELVVHPKKIGEIRNWINWSQKEKAPILLVTGPSGSGKTTTVKLTAKEEGILVKEWINPVEKTDYKTEPVFLNEMFDKCSFSETKQSDKFCDFIFQSSRYKSLFDEEEKVLILVEDIPNIYVWRPKLFHEFLGKYKINGRSPIVFILTDDQNLNLSLNLFPNNIKSKYNITNIKFNPVNHSSLIKNLKMLSSIYCPENVSSEFLETFIKNSNGDLRTATRDLLLFLRTNPENLNCLPKSKKTKTSNGLKLNCKAVTEKDSSFDFYHILGRILYPKLKSEKEKLDCDNPHRIFTHDVQKIADSWTGPFLSILHENYLQTFTKLNDVVQGADCFSFCDILNCNWELQEYEGLVGTITLMLRNTEPKKNGFNPLKKSVQLAPVNPDYDEETENYLYGCQLRRRDFLLDVKPFIKYIKASAESARDTSESCSQGKESVSCENSEEFLSDSVLIEEVEV